MKNPFYISDELTLSRTEIEAANLDELLKQIKRAMALMGLKHRRIGANKLYFSQSSFTLGLGQNTAIKSVTVTLLYTEDTIQIHFKTSLKILLILSLIPVLIFLIPKQDFIPSIFMYLYPFYLLVAYAVTKISLGNTRYVIKVFLLKEV
ncbi:MAG: hypothetical protein EBS86_10245 [Crocinitomicaceae bacterium]|nr:hypothetical protein [Crocinitomicaceae bacterium]